MRFLKVEAVLLLLTLSVPAMALEEPRYTVVKSHDRFEIRRYDPYVVAETRVKADHGEAGNIGFRILARYIFGANQGARKIDMTAPVNQVSEKIEMTVPVAQVATEGDGNYLIQFAMPKDSTPDSLPVPTDPRVSFRVLPARTVAVLRYSGTWSQARYESHLKEMQDALAAANLRWHGAPTWARYDPPLKPWFMRRNEIWLDVD